MFQHLAKVWLWLDCDSNNMINQYLIINDYLREECCLPIALATLKFKTDKFS